MLAIPPLVLPGASGPVACGRWSHVDFFLSWAPGRAQVPLTGAVGGGGSGQGRGHHQVRPGRVAVHGGGLPRPELQAGTHQGHELLGTVDGPGRGHGSQRGPQGTPTFKSSPNSLLPESSHVN